MINLISGLVLSFYSIEFFQLFVFWLFSVWLWMGLFFFSTLQWWICKPVVSVSRVYYHSEWRAISVYIVQAGIISVRHFPGPLRTVRASQLPAVKIQLCAFTFWPGILISTDSLLTMVKITIWVTFRRLVLALYILFVLFFLPFIIMPALWVPRFIFWRSDRKGHTDLVMTQGL